MKLLERKLLSFTSKIEREISIFSFFFSSTVSSSSSYPSVKSKNNFYNIFFLFIFGLLFIFSLHEHLEEKKKITKQKKVVRLSFFRQKSFLFVFLLFIHSIVSFAFHLFSIFNLSFLHSSSRFLGTYFTLRF